MLLLLTLFPGCQQSAPVTTSVLPSGISSDGADAFLEVDCLLPGQVRKLGTMVYASPRRPVKTTASDCTIRGGEYVMYDRANYKEALAVWMVEAEAGDPVAQTYVGEIYMKSPPEKPRYDLAAQWFEKAAGKGHKRAQVNLAYLYENGLGVPADMNRAVSWYSKASGANIQEIVQQQQQLSAEERAELAELKAQNSAQIAELGRLKKEMGAAEKSLASVRKELEKRNSAIAAQQQEIAGRQEEVKKIAQQLAAKKVAVATDLQQKLGELERGLKEKEQQLTEQKRLAAELSGQLNKQQQEEKHFKTTLAGLNEKLASLPGPKIEVLDPQLLRTRGVVVAPVDKGQAQRAITGQVWSPAGLQYLKINGRETEFKADGKFRSVFSVGADEVKVQIVATDQNGKSDEMLFTLQQQDARGEGDKADHETAKQQGSTVQFGNYYALVIGNNEYRKLPKLQTAVEDAKTVGRLLEDRYGFKVTLLYNADRNAILSSLNDFRKKLTEKDNLLIYYAGHGTLEEKNSQGFWLPVDSSLDDDVNWIPTDRITGIMNLMSAKQIMVIADACYSGIMTRASLTRLEAGQSEESYNKWLAKMAAYKSRVIISSGETKPVLDGGGGNHSVFAKALLDTLNGNTKVLLGIDLHRAIAEKVVDASGRMGHDQVPQYAGLNRAGHELGDFLFVPKQQGT
jgi:TPR repeat protein